MYIMILAYKILEMEENTKKKRNLKSKASGGFEPATLRHLQVTIIVFGIVLRGLLTQ